LNNNIVSICHQRFLFNVFKVFYFFIKNAFLKFFILVVNGFKSMLEPTLSHLMGHCSRSFHNKYLHYR